MNPTTRPLTDGELEELQDREDAEAVARCMEDMRSGKEKTVPLADILKKYGMEHPERKNAA